MSGKEGGRGYYCIKKFSDSLAWETGVWIANMPNHMIHLNGDNF